MNSVRLLLLVAFVLYETRNTNSFKLLKNLLAKHMQPVTEQRPVFVEPSMYPAPYTFNMDGSPAVVEWNGGEMIAVNENPALPVTRNDGEIINDGGAADVNAETGSEYEHHDNDHGADQPLPVEETVVDSQSDAVSLKDRICNKIASIKSAFDSVKEKVRSAKETDIDSTFIINDGGEKSSSAPVTDDTDKCTVCPTVKPSTVEPSTTTVIPDKNCATYTPGKVVVECHSEVVQHQPPPVIIVESPPRKLHHYHYYYSPLPYYCQSEPNGCLGQQIDYSRYVPYTTNNGAQWTLGNVPYYYYYNNNNYPGGQPMARPNGVGQWVSRYGGNYAGPVFGKQPAVPYHDGDNAIPYTKPIAVKPIGVYSANGNGNAPTTQGSTDDGSEYSSRGDIPWQGGDDPASQPKDVYEIVKERRHAEHLPGEKSSVETPGPVSSSNTPPLKSKTNVQEKSP